MKKAMRAVILSFICPGLGQFYNRQYKKAWLFVASILVFSLLLGLGGIWIVYGIADNKRSEVIWGFLFFILGLFALMFSGILSMFDAYTKAAPDEDKS